MERLKMDVPECARLGKVVGVDGVMSVDGVGRELGVAGVAGVDGVSREVGVGGMGEQELRAKGVE